MTAKGTCYFGSICLIGSVLLLEFFAGCFWIPEVETEIYNSSQGIVSLRTLGDDSLRADHPVVIRPSTMAKVLRGAHRFRDLRLIEGLMSDDEEPVRLFSESQIAFLAPLLSSALAQATSEEKVVFQCTAEPEKAPPIKGNMLVYDSTLFLTWHEPLSKPNVLAKQHRRTTLPDPSMPQEHTLMFFPKEAIRVKNNTTARYLKRLNGNTVAIDYQVLAGLPKSSFDSPALQGEQKGSQAEAVRASDQPSRTRSPEAAPLESQPDSTSEIELRELKEQMDKLQKEMTKQQKELERLKKEKP